MMHGKQENNFSQLNHKKSSLNTCFLYPSQKSKTSECVVLEYICIECVHYDLIFHIHVANSALVYTCNVGIRYLKSSWKSHRECMPIQVKVPQGTLTWKHKYHMMWSSSPDCRKTSNSHMQNKKRSWPSLHAKLSVFLNNRPPSMGIKSCKMLAVERTHWVRTIACLKRTRSNTPNPKIGSSWHFFLSWLTSVVQYHQW